ncbi:trypsin alpha-like [Ischnura elegans]|uniref:trypsin alpha-like n=1 Tax=Ischnura elegans TaxID=197161 RepID=UPI001ED8A5DA|nr:trypsin alpha-like [Ischnura elegans]
MKDNMFRCLLLASLVVCSLGHSPKLWRPRFNGKIVGGEQANIEDYPYQLVLRRSNAFECGAAIISENLAITAAHCTDGAKPSYLTVRAGSSIVNSGGSIHQVTKIHQHPGFDIYVLDGDISIIEVSPPFEFGRGVQPIALPDSDMDVAVGSSADVSGWGTTSDDGYLPDHLRHVFLQIIDQDECNQAYGYITDTMMCAKAPGKDSCQGDSGGPLVQDGKLVGIVSFGQGCADPRYPGVYARVTALRDWIKQEVGL